MSKSNYGDDGESVSLSFLFRQNVPLTNIATRRNLIVQKHNYFPKKYIIIIFNK